MNKHHVMGILGLVFALVTFLLTTTFPAGGGRVHTSGPAFFPRVVALILALAAIWELIVGTVSAVRNGERTISTRKVWDLIRTSYALNMAMIITLVVFFIVMFRPLGFILTGFTLVFLVMLRLGVPLLKNIITAVIIVTFIQLLFGRIFSISLPSGVLSVIGL